MDKLREDDANMPVDNFNHDIRVMREYWEDYPGELIDLKISRGVNDHVTILLWTRDNQDREDDLRSKLVHGDELEILYSRWPLSRLEEIKSSIQALWKSESQGAFRSMGQHWDSIRVSLRADQESLAVRLSRDYGDAVDITLGTFSYPPGKNQPSPKVRQRLPRSMDSPEEINFPGLEISFELSSPIVAAGADGHGRVRLRNSGSNMITFESGSPLVGKVLDPLTGESVGGFQGAIAGVGKNVNLDVGEEATIGVVFGTASLDFQKGYVLQPGNYLASVRVPVYNWMDDATSIHQRFIQVPPATLEVVAN